MAGNVEMRNYMQNVLGIADQTLRTTIIEEGMDSWDAYNTLGPDGIKGLCESIRKPGGLLANGQPNRGHAVPVLVELHLRQLAYWMRYCNTTQREFNRGQATRNNLELLWAHKLGQEEQAMDETPEPKKFTRDVKVRDLFEDFETILSLTQSRPGGNLMYVIREHVEVENRLMRGRLGHS